MGRGNVNTEDTLLDASKIANPAFYLSALDQLNPATFRYLSDTEQQALSQQLLTTLYLQRIAAEEHFARGRHKDLSHCVARMDCCLDYLAKLKPTHADSLPVASSGHLKYIGLRMRVDFTQSGGDGTETAAAFEEEAKQFVAYVRELQLAETDRYRTQQVGSAVRADIGFFNDYRRLWWVWGTMMFGAVYDIMGYHEVTLPYQDNTNMMINAVAPTLGIISWTMYYFRGLMDLGEGISEAFSRFKHDRSKFIPLIKLEDKGIWGRLGEQWSRRKFIMLNDFLWGTANTASFFYLNGPLKTTLGMAGYLLALGLLVGDFLLTAWRFYETQQQYEKTRLSLTEEKAQLEKASDELSKNRLAEIGRSLQHLDFEWFYQRRKLVNELIYTVNLVWAFALVCIPPMFVDVGMQLILGVAGTGALFGVSIIFNVVNGLIDRQKLAASAKGFDEEIKALEALQQREPDNRLYGLQIQALTARSEHDKALAAYKLKCAPLNTLIDVMMPLVAFLSFNFLSLGMGILVLASCAVVIYAAKKVMKSWEPTPVSSKFFPTARDATPKTPPQVSQDSDDESESRSVGIYN